jgi:antitoxin VapB
MAQLPSPTTPYASEAMAPYAAASPVRLARLFRNGANQAVRIPREFEMPPGEVSVKKVGNSLVLEPVRSQPEQGTAAALAAALHSMKDWPVVHEPFPDANEGLPPLDEIDL